MNNIMFPLRRSNRRYGLSGNLVEKIHAAPPNTQKNEIIIYQPWGGLGDNLQFSTLPELYHSLGYKVYISNDNAHRNSEIYDLVWGNNPYVLGKKQGISNAGSCRERYWPPESDNEWFLHRIEIAHGFPRSSDYPKIYYCPTVESHLNDTVIVDITGFSSVFANEKYYEFFDKIQNVIQENMSNIKIISFKYTEINKKNIEIYQKYFGNYESLIINNIYEYCDVLKSCKMFITVNSGAHSLAAAIKKDNISPRIICYNQFGHFTPERIKGFYNYKNVEYINSNI
jgi:hypothetical protein